MKWVAVAGTVAVVAAAAMWWSRSPSPEDAGRVTDASPGASSQAMAAQVPASSTMTAAQIEVETKVMQERQQEAAKELEKQPGLKPIVGPIKERPSFVSALEWQMLKGVSQQAGDPDRELTRLVNFLRFNKQLELWEGMSQSPDKARRKELADQLIGELPVRITQGEMDLTEAKRILTGLLNDAEPDAQARGKRAAAETARLASTADAVAAATQGRSP
ncbi:hypothetical protein [Aquabacterium sp.]|uniref:hypothetical protein n=1 Tax=Aquabacterium sp. TaxID=1872578 RepID=UPI0040377404